MVGGHRMWVTPGVCYRLAKLPRMSRSTETASGHAIAVLAHEAWHLHGVQNEGIVNCYAYQSGVQVGRALGLSAGTARRLMHEQLADNPATSRARRTSSRTAATAAAASTYGSTARTSPSSR